MIGYILAIGAAATWSMVALSATRIVRYFGSYNYNLLRLLGIIVLFLPYVIFNWDPIYFDKSISFLVECSPRNTTDLPCEEPLEIQSIHATL